MKGKFIFHIGDKTYVWDNHIMDDGVKKMMRTLADVAETDNLLLWMSVGTSDATPDDTSLSALVAEVGDANKYAIGSHSVNAVYPFDLELNITIPANDIAATTVLKEVGIWWGTSGAKKLFARATDATGITVVLDQVVPVKYDLNII